MRYNRDDVLARVDLEALADTLLGPRHPRIRTWSCPNPDHPQTGRTPPVTVFVDRRGEQRWHCHGCGNGGTAIDLVLQAGPTSDFREAVEWLAGQAGVASAPVSSSCSRRVGRPPPEEPAARPSAQTRRQLGAYAEGCAAYLHGLGGREVRAWLTEVRAIPLEVLETVGIGADPGPRRLPRPDGVPKVFPAAVFPVREDGEVIFTVSRLVRPWRDLPPWLNTARSVAANPLVALFQPAGRSTGGAVVVTEGALDGLSAVAAGYRAAVLLGTGTVKDVVADRLAALGDPLLLATDNDAAGRLARHRLASLLADRGVELTVLPIPERFKDLNDWHVACHDRWASTLRSSIRLAAAGHGRAPTPPTVA